MFRIVATDLDGTLLPSDSTVDPFTAQTLREISALGVGIVIATARHYLDACYYRDALGVRAYLVTLNGARAHDPSGEPMIAEDLSPALARELMSPELVRHRHLSILVDEGWMVNRPCPELDRYFRASGFRSHLRDLTVHDGSGLAKVTYMGQPEDLAQLEEEIRARFGDQIAITSSTPIFLEIMAKTASKGRALTRILERLAIPASECVAFGDAHNDLDMLQIAGRPFVMAQSSPALRAALPAASVAGSNDEAGVARALKQLFWP